MVESINEYEKNNIVHYVIKIGDYKISLKNGRIYLRKNNNLFLEVKLAQFLVDLKSGTRDEKCQELLEVYGALSETAKRCLKIENGEYLRKLDEKRRSAAFMSAVYCLEKHPDADETVEERRRLETRIRELKNFSYDFVESPFRSLGYYRAGEDE